MAKTKVAVVVDSTANLPEELIKQYNMHVIPLSVNWEGQSLHDGVDITADEFYQRLPVAKEMPTTSQPSAGEFHDLFTQVARTAESIVCVTISSELSGTWDSATAARDMMEGVPIEIIDSRSASMGTGFMALAAARAAEQGADHKAAADAARALVEQMRVMFVVDTLEFLHRGGRIGGARRLIGSVLSIKPLLHLQDGKIEPLASVRTKRKAVNHLIDTLVQESAGKKGIHLAVMHAAAPEEARQLGEELQKRIESVELLYGELSPVLGTHTGPGTVGAGFYAEG